MRPVDSRRDHVFGSDDAPYTIVEYGDFQCGFCLKASGSIQEVRAQLGDQLRYVWRHAPLTQTHPNALAGAEAAEAASLQGRFFEFERGLFADQENQVNVRRNKVTRTALFRPGDEPQRIAFD